MARARNIKPSFFSNEKLVELDFGTRLLFIGLWTLADREGRLEDRPKRIKMEIFPADDINIDRALQALHVAGLALRYEADGQRYIWIPKFKRHQSPHYSEKPSLIKPHPLQEKAQDISREDSWSDGGIKDDELREDSEKIGSSTGGRNPLNPESRILNPENTPPTPLADAKGESAPNGHDSIELVGKAKREKRPAKRPMPEGWTPSETTLAWVNRFLAEHGLNEDWAQRQHELFATKAKARGWVYADWDRAYEGFFRENGPGGRFAA